MNEPTPTQRVERLRKLKYNGGGYFRDDTIPKGTTAEIVHAPEVLKEALQLATELETAQRQNKNLLIEQGHAESVREEMKHTEVRLRQQLADKTRECEANQIQCVACEASNEHLRAENAELKKDKDGCISFLQSLCESCHNPEHERQIKSFLKTLR